MWNFDNKKGSGNLVFFEEGNLKVFKFTEQPTKCQFLTKEVDIDAIMAEKKLTNEEAIEFIKNELQYEEWISPISFWEHRIPSIPNQRFFSKVICQGKRSCPLCLENDQAKENGITENKMLPFPVGRVFVVPAYFYELDMVLFVKQSQDFFEDIAMYIKKNGVCDFEIYKTGKGFDTTYKAIFSGKVEHCGHIPPIKPSEIDFTISEKDLEDKTAVRGFSRAEPNIEPKNQPSTGDAKSFKLPFGSHKGKTLEEVYLVDPEYIAFLKTNSVGLVVEKIEEFLNGLS